MIQVLKAELQQAVERSTRTPNDAEAHIEVAKAFARLGEPLNALMAVQRAIEIDPSLARAYFNASEILLDLGELDAADSMIETAVDLAPNWPNARYLLGLRRLARGRWSEGWSGHEQRLLIAEYQTLVAPPLSPEWRGESIAGQHLVIDAEQGHGDTIQFFRFVKAVRDLGATVTVRVSSGLVSLLDGVFGARVIALDDPLPPHDRHALLLSLPQLLRCTTDEDLGRQPYLTARGDSPPGIETLRSPDGRPAVGIVWSGRAWHPMNRRRSLPADMVAKLASAVPDVHLVSLQHDIDHGLDSGSATLQNMTNAVAFCSDFNASAHVMQRLDHMVSVCTGPAHLAGALGVPTTVLLGHAADWRWMYGRTDSPWYGSISLIRQQRPFDWSTVFEQLVPRLQALVRHA